MTILGNLRNYRDMKLESTRLQFVNDLLTKKLEYLDTYSCATKQQPLVYQTATILKQIESNNQSIDEYQRLMTQTINIVTMFDDDQRYRQIISLYYFEGYQLADIAKLINLAYDTVRKLHAEITRAFETLEQMGVVPS